MVLLYIILYKNHDFITAWHKDSHDLWTRQAQIDQQLQTRINELQTMVIHLGDQVQQLTFQTRICCHWNFTSFCLTNMPYNSTEYPWDKVKVHLQDLTDNSSLGIHLLKQQVSNFQVKVPKELHSTQFYDTLWLGRRRVDALLGRAVPRRRRHTRLRQRYLHGCIG